LQPDALDLFKQFGNRGPQLELVAWSGDKTNYLMQFNSPIFNANIIK